MRFISRLRDRRCPSLEWPEWGSVVALVVLAGVLRFFALGRIPPGLYHDEAFNGLDALGVLEGHTPPFFEANNGREPLFIYLVSVAVGALGRTPGAIRIVSALVGTLTVPVTYGMAREVFGRRVALWTALILAISVWPVNLSRTGFRAVTMPLATAVAVWWLWRAFRSDRKADFAVAGACLGLLLYTYLAARFAPLALAAFALYAVCRRRAVIPWGSLLLFAGVALLVALPLASYLIGHWELMVARGQQVAITNPVINGGDFWGTLARHLVRSALAFTHRGDFIPRHNVPLRPVFDPCLAIGFVGGLILSAVRSVRGKSEYAFLLLWVGVMWMPTVLAEDAPHFLRGVGVLPLVCVIPAVALDGFRQAMARRASGVAAVALIGLVVVASLASTWRDYFVGHGSSEEAYYEFETGAVELSSSINRFLGSGWDGTGLGLPVTEPRLGRHVYLAARLWDNWTAVRYLVPESEQLTILPAKGGIPAVAESQDDVMLVLWPFERPLAHLSLLPVGAIISVHEGASERGDLESEARLLYVTYLAERDSSVNTGVRRDFAEGISLLDAQVSCLAENEVRIRLIWQADKPVSKDYTVFVHVLRDGQMVTTGDARPAGGYYPTTLWRSGDTIVDDHRVSLPGPLDSQVHRILVGLYELQTMSRLPLVDEAGCAMGESVDIPITSD